MSSARGSNSARSGTTERRSVSPVPAAKDQLGLRTLVQQRFLKDVFQMASDKCGGWKILVVDERAMHVISAAVGMYDIMERRVTLVESLEKKRAPFPDMGAIYLLEPTEQSVTKVIEDFSSSQPLYGVGVFLCFLRRLPDNLLNRLKTCKPLLKRLKALLEVNIDFITKEERVYMFDMRDSFSAFYLRKQITPVERSIAQKLVTVCATLNEYPHIRYKQSSGICTSLASVFHLMMDEFVAQNSTWWYHGGPMKNKAAVRERGTLLLLDRSDDCLTPLMHDFIYQSMVHDLLKMDGDCITYDAEKPNDPSQKEPKDVLLDEKDAIWVELRGNHIAKVIEILSERIREIMNSSTGSALGKGEGNMSLSQMASALKALPEYREVMSKLSQHMHLAHHCMDVLRKESLMELSELEQTLATGKDEDGKAPKLADMIDTAERLLKQMENPKAKVRLLLILIISQGGLRPQDRLRLMNAADLSKEDTATLNTLEVFGLSTVASNDKKGLSALFGGGRVAAAGAASDEDAEYAASRYIPPIKTILEDMMFNTLSLEEYPSVLPMPDMSSSASTRSSKSSRSSRRGDAASVRKTSGATSRWSKSSASDGKRSSGPTHFMGGRSMVFMVGGMAFSEVSAARDLMFKESREVVVGSTAFISPKDFIADLESLRPESFS